MTNCAFIVGNLIFNRKIPLQTCLGLRPVHGANNWPLKSMLFIRRVITVKIYKNPILDSKTYKMLFTSVCKASVPFL